MFKLISNSKNLNESLQSNNPDEKAADVAPVVPPPIDVAQLVAAPTSVPVPSSAPAAPVPAEENKEVLPDAIAKAVEGLVDIDATLIQPLPSLDFMNPPAEIVKEVKEVDDSKPVPPKISKDIELRNKYTSNSFFMP